MRVLKIFFIYLKRRFKDTAFMAAAVLVLAVIPYVAGLDTDKRVGMSVGFVCTDDELAQHLTGAEGTVSFTRYDDEKALTRAVENESVSCGYLIPNDIYSDIKNNKSGAITCLKSPASVLTKTTDEALFARLVELYSTAIARDYLDENSVSYDAEKLNNYYNTYLQQDKNNYVDYVYVDSAADTAESGETGGKSHNALYGLLAVYIMLGGILCINTWLKDDKKNLPYGFMNVVSGVVILSVTAAAAIVLMGKTNKAVILGLLPYSVLVIAYCGILRCFFGSTPLLCGFMTLLIPCSLIICPVFADISTFLPQITSLRYILPPHYFTKGFISQTCGAAVMCVLSVVLNILRIKIKL